MEFDTFFFFKSFFLGFAISKRETRRIPAEGTDRKMVKS